MNSNIIGAKASNKSKSAKSGRESSYRECKIWNSLSGDVGSSRRNDPEIKKLISKNLQLKNDLKETQKNNEVLRMKLIKYENQISDLQTSHGDILKKLEQLQNKVDSHHPKSSSNENAELKQKLDKVIGESLEKI